MSKPKPDTLWVYANQDGEGYTYSLHPLTEQKVCALAPHAQIAARLFLAQDVSQDFARVHHSLANHILPMLTRLSLDELLALGTWEFRRPNKTDDLLFIWPNETTQESSSQSPKTKQTIAPTPKASRPAQRKAAG